MSRAHAGETPTSFVVQGFIDFLVSNHEIARELRDYVVFKVVGRGAGGGGGGPNFGQHLWFPEYFEQLKTQEIFEEGCLKKI